ncbi:hypothetical protein CXG81DRAFT_26955 [Caulochytrium protostelioides]|uniref:Fungal lipase-type domain-containing protein n=1 Tax=Caulochytrium protostelioides TaxID=1555241 RepID=A0A4P9X5F0_9FUNG|nr:hypothetical protein CXG81DRAFT_26955 [Caulochytrium protostelioides]|eukprot:RKP00335.1 hypothetical protein CXG81DRAFT_26955 [Caulochytrium protostelioides]
MVTPLPAAAACHAPVSGAMADVDNPPPATAAVPMADTAAAAMTHAPAPTLPPVASMVRSASAGVGGDGRATSSAADAASAHAETAHAEPTQAGSTPPPPPPVPPDLFVESSELRGAAATGSRLRHGPHTTPRSRRPVSLITPPRRPVSLLAPRCPAREPGVDAVDADDGNDGGRGLELAATAADGDIDATSDRGAAHPPQRPRPFSLIKVVETVFKPLRMSRTEQALQRWRSAAALHRPPSATSAASLADSAHEAASPVPGPAAAPEPVVEAATVKSGALLTPVQLKQLARDPAYPSQLLISVVDVIRLPSSPHHPVSAHAPILDLATTPLRVHASLRFTEAVAPPRLYAAADTAAETAADTAADAADTRHPRIFFPVTFQNYMFDVLKIDLYLVPVSAPSRSTFRFSLSPKPSTAAAATAATTTAAVAAREPRWGEDPGPPPDLPPRTAPSPTARPAAAEASSASLPAPPSLSASASSTSSSSSSLAPRFASLTRPYDVRKNKNYLGRAHVRLRTLADIDSWRTASTVDTFPILDKRQRPTPYAIRLRLDFKLLLGAYLERPLRRMSVASGLPARDAAADAASAADHDHVSSRFRSHDTADVAMGADADADADEGSPFPGRPRLSVTADPSHGSACRPYDAIPHAERWADNSAGRPEADSEAAGDDISGASGDAGSARLQVPGTRRPPSGTLAPAAAYRGRSRRCSHASRSSSVRFEDAVTGGQADDNHDSHDDHEGDGDADDANDRTEGSAHSDTMSVSRRRRRRRAPLHASPNESHEALDESMARIGLPQLTPQALLSRRGSAKRILSQRSQRSAKSMAFVRPELAGEGTLHQLFVTTVKIYSERPGLIDPKHASPPPSPSPSARPAASPGRGHETNPASAADALGGSFRYDGGRGEVGRKGNLLSFDLDGVHYNLHESAGFHLLPPGAQTTLREVKGIAYALFKTGWQIRRPMRAWRAIQLLREWREHRVVADQAPTSAPAMAVAIDAAVDEAKSRPEDAPSGRTASHEGHVSSDGNAPSPSFGHDFNRGIPVGEPDHDDHHGHADHGSGSDAGDSGDSDDVPFYMDPVRVAEDLRWIRYVIGAHGLWMMRLSGLVRLHHQLLHAHYRSIFLSVFRLRKEQLLAWEYGKKEPGRPRFLIVHEPAERQLVIAIQGTLNVSEVITDITSDYWPLALRLCEGLSFCHLGFLRSALWFMEHWWTRLLAMVRDHNVDRICLVGHSLGGATAALLTLILRETADQLERAAGHPVDVRAVCFGAPPTVSRNLAEACAPYITNYVNGADYIPHLSFGLVVEYRDLLMEANAQLRQNADRAAAYAALDAKAAQSRRDPQDLLWVAGRLCRLVAQPRLPRPPPRHPWQHAWRAVRRYLPRWHAKSPAPAVAEALPRSALAQPVPDRGFLTQHFIWNYMHGIEGHLRWLHAHQVPAKVAASTSGQLSGDPVLQPA